MEIENIYKQVGHLKDDTKNYRDARIVTKITRPPYEGKHKNAKATNRPKPKRRK